MSSTIDTPRHAASSPAISPPHPHEVVAQDDQELNHDADDARQPARRKRRWLVPALSVAGVAGIIVTAMLATGMSQRDENLVLYTVRRADLPITIVERGTLESQENVKIVCELDDVRGDGIDGTPINWLIRNGASVKKGDLLIEFASSSLQAELDDQILDTEAARSQQIQATAKYDNQITQNKTAEENAELTVKLAELELEMYTDQDSGTLKLEMEEIRRLIEDANNEILAAQANLELKKNESQGVETLFKLGYAGKSELDRTRLDFLQAESSHAAKINKLQTQLATLDKKEKFEQQMQLLTLQGALETARREHEQVLRDNEALLNQARAAKAAADESLKKEEERLARYKEQLEKTKVYAPQDGMVVYAVADSRRYWMEEIREGANARERQHILSLPNLKRMQVKLSVHESVLNQVDEGLRATVQVEALPDRKYPGEVKAVAVLADQVSTDTKMYETTVTIDGEVDQLRPGMTAVVEIHVAHLKDVVSVPVQAIVQVEDKTWCYVERGGRAHRRPVELGMTNDKFVEIKSGVEEGEQVVLNPMAVMDEKDREQSAPQPDDGAAPPPTEEPPASPSDAAPADSI
ncbi:MAG: efflux RND transporter periplasmic adaptor subunit [Planctomycetes bacterium]|nr:efflux RND transporter periplasmic adaptor subunit [Planctomycetota bacterium]